jgi:hypothetical protein
VRPGSSALLARVALRAMDQSATVYTRDGQGKYTVVAQSGLKCLLQSVNRQSAATGPDRAALAKEGDFRWEPSYDLPENAQIEVDAYPGQRWNVKAGTLWADMAPGEVAILRHCDVVKAS